MPTPRLVRAMGVCCVLSLGLAISPMSAASGAEPTSTTIASPSAADTEAWAEDLARIDDEVRAHHPAPFAIHPESAWREKLEELGQTIPAASTDEQIVQLASLAGLLDSHSYVYGPLHLYAASLYRFPEGWFVVAAEDPSLVGSRLVSIGGTSVDEVEQRLRPIVPADNESAKLLGVSDAISTVEFLHGLGIVDDATEPGYVFEKPDGTTITSDLPIETNDGAWATSLVGYLLGDATEAVARRTEAVWTRLDDPSKTFLLSYNDYSPTDLGSALQEMTTALDDGAAERVVVDMRYLRGGDGSLARPLTDALKSDRRVDRPGGLTVLIGRENQSAGTLVAGWLDHETDAVLVGEPTPARADNFLCDCYEIPIGRLPGFILGVPTVFLDNGDKRDAVIPNVPLVLTAADFFSGKDPALDLALSGPSPSPAPE